MILDSYFTSKVTGVGFLVIYVADINASRLRIEHYRGRFPLSLFHCTAYSISKTSRNKLAFMYVPLKIHTSLLSLF